jgi:hypothetical protein
MAIVAAIMKIFGAIVSLISGLSALSYQTRDQNRLTRFGQAVLAALLLGTAFSSGGVVLDWFVKKADDAHNEERIRQLQLAADAARFPTADASASIAVSVDKSLPSLRALIATLDTALAYATKHCRIPGGVAPCRDYIIRGVIIDEIRFDKKSSLFPSFSKDRVAFGIMTGLGVVVRFYHDRFMPNLSLDENTIGGMVLTHGAISGSMLYEYDGTRLRWFIDGKLPPEAFKVAGVLSIVDVLGKGVTARPFAKGDDVCPKETLEHDCDLHLLALLRATKIEVVDFRFPHRKNIRIRMSETISEDNFDVPYVYRNLPSTLEGFRDE